MRREIGAFAPKNSPGCRKRVSVSMRIRKTTLCWAGANGLTLLIHHSLKGLHSLGNHPVIEGQSELDDDAQIIEIAQHVAHEALIFL